MGGTTVGADRVAAQPGPHPRRPGPALLRDRLDEAAGLLIGQGLGQVALADHADQPVAVDDRQAPHLVLLHGAPGLLERVVGADGDDLRTLGEGRNRHLVRVLTRRHDLHDDVAIGHHPCEAVVVPTDRQCSHVERGHPLGGGRDGVVLRDALGALGHDVTRCAGHLSSFWSSGT